METKQCGMCKELLPKTDEFFATRKDRKENEFQHNCRECQKEYRKKHYENNKIKYVNKAKLQTKKMVDWFLGIKSKLKCEVCGEDRHWVLDFHHTDPKQKDFEVSKMIRSVSKETILNEISKCKVLCANCHRDLHYQEKIASIA